MTTTTFVAGTVVASNWLNDVNDYVYEGMQVTYSTTAPKFGMNVAPSSTNVLLVRSTDSNPTYGATVQFQRYETADNGLSNPKCLKVSYTQQGTVATASHDWAISGDCTYRNTSSGNMVSVSGVTTREVAGTGVAFGGHFQSKDDVVYGAPTSVSNAVGAEINIACQGLDHPTSNGNMGNRIVLHVLAHGVNPYGVAGQNAEIGRGIAIETEGEASGAYFRTALDISESSSNTNVIGVGIRIQTTGTHGINMLGAHTTGDIVMAGNSAYGLICNGTYTNAAIRVADDQYIGLRANNAIKFKYDTTGTTRVQFLSSGTERVGLNMSGTPGLFLNSTQVVSTRITGWAAATNTKSKATFDTTTVTLPNLAARVGQLIDDLMTHGLIGT